MRGGGVRRDSTAWDGEAGFRLHLNAAVDELCRQAVRRLA